MIKSKQTVSVFIPTFSGPVRIISIEELDRETSRSVVCIDGSTRTTLPGQRDYQAFVSAPTGPIETLFGHSRYRVDVSGPIDAGCGWQLGLLAAHALHHAGRLAACDQPADIMLLATGEARYQLDVAAIGHLQEKMDLSTDVMRAASDDGRPIVYAFPAANGDDLDDAARQRLAGFKARVLPLTEIDALFQELNLPLATRAVTTARSWRTSGMVGVLTESLHLDENEPTLDQLRSTAEKCGVSFDMFVTQAVLHWAQVCEEEIRAGKNSGGSLG